MGTRERRSRSDECDLLLSKLFKDSGADEKTMAIAAVGSFGRGELAPGSDLDIVIFHSDTIPAADLAELVNKILYPLWDSKFKVDHSVRTYNETKEALHDDLKVAMGLLDIRLIAGSADLVADVQVLALDTWRNDADKYLALLESSLHERHLRAGELAYLLEPDLKESRGGLRDITALKAINTSGRVVLPMERISRAESLLSTVREALHTVSGRDKDRLLFSEQDKVAELLGYADADLLVTDVAHSARAVDYLMQMALHRLHNRGRDGLGRFLKRIRSTVVGEGISVSNNELVIDSTIDINVDPMVGLRAAAKAAQLGLPLSFDSLKTYSEKLKSGAGALPNPWPREAREYLIALIGAGPAMIEIFEALDQEDVLINWLPEWAGVRSLPQRNVLHRHTVDRHMVETAVAAAALTRQVHRPDLLLFTALFHDIGKGTEDDHSLRGEQLIEPLALRLGFTASDTAIIQILIRHHLLLSATATRRDLDDPATIATVTTAISDLQTLELLHALSIADGEATGKAAWSAWKASLVSDLVRRSTLALRDNTIESQPELSELQVEKAATGELHVEIEDRGNFYALEIVAPDSTGLLSIVAGVLNVLRLDVKSARTRTLAEVAVMEWIVLPDPNAPDLTAADIQSEIKRAFADQGLLSEKIQSRIKAYSSLPTIPVPAPIVETFLDAATDATIIEVRSHDRPALLFSIGDAIRRCNIDIRAAIVTTLGAEAIDTLYVTEVGGGALTSERANQVADQLTQSLK
jgi:[protein-PII] uridylyltransferase